MPPSTSASVAKRHELLTIGMARVFTDEGQGDCRRFGQGAGEMETGTVVSPVGDRILFAKYVGTPEEVSGDKLLMVREEDARSASLKPECAIN